MASPMLIVAGSVLTLALSAGAVSLVSSAFPDMAQAVNASFEVCYTPQNNNLETLSASAEGATEYGAKVDEQHVKCQALYGELRPALDAFLNEVASLEDLDLEAIQNEALRAEVAKWQGVLTADVLAQLRTFDNEDDALAYWQTVVVAAEKGGEL